MKILKRLVKLILFIPFVFVMLLGLSYAIFKWLVTGKEISNDGTAINNFFDW